MRRHLLPDPESCSSPWPGCVPLPAEWWPVDRVARRFDPYHKLGVFTKVLSYIENNYVEDIPD